jgi:hypothetical protein
VRRPDFDRWTRGAVARWALTVVSGRWRRDACSLRSATTNIERGAPASDFVAFRLRSRNFRSISRSVFGLVRREGDAGLVALLLLLLYAGWIDARGFSTEAMGCLLLCFARQLVTPMQTVLIIRRLRSLRGCIGSKLWPSALPHIASDRLMLAALALFPQSSVKMAPPRRSHRFAQ